MGKSKKEKPEQSQSFEQSLEELQQIVDDLEEGSVGLEESMQRFEKGVGLLRSCYQILEKAEQNIEILTGIDADGNPVTSAFDASATADKSKGAGKRKSKKQQPATTDDEPNDDGPSTLF